MHEYRALPETGDQEWLLDQLAAIVAAHGATRLLTAPLVEPDDHFFPDRWEPTLEGARALLLRLLRYAGMGRFDVALWVGEYSEATGSIDPRGGAHGREGAAAWFAGIERRTCLFGLDAAQLDDAEGVAGAFAHEVAHAWRERHGLVVADRALEEELTDITTVYLGFGVLTTNVSSRHRTRGRWEGAGYVHEWSHARKGYLPPEAMSFLLAAYCVARGFEARDRREVASALEANQAQSFRAAWDALAAPGRELGERLGLPPADAWPDPLDAEAFVREGGAPGPCEAPLERAAAGEATAGGATCPLRPSRCVAPSVHEAPPEADPGLPVDDAPLAPRVVRSRAPHGAAFGGVLGALLASGVGALLPRGQEAIPTAWAAVGAVVGGALGRRYRRDVCGAHRCGASVSVEADACPRCGALVLDDDHPWLPIER